MDNLNQIGLNEMKAMELTKELNELLANYSIFYQNVRGYHWNIKGEKFFELHAKFEELYNDLFVKIDEIAEELRGQCMLSLEDILEREGIDENDFDHSYLDSLVFLCEDCGWWCEISEMNDSGDWVCEDC